MATHILVANDAFLDELKAAITCTTFRVVTVRGSTLVVAMDKAVDRVIPSCSDVVGLCTLQQYLFGSNLLKTGGHVCIPAGRAVLDLLTP